jgi:hypothetical protein
MLAAPDGSATAAGRRQQHQSRSGAAGRCLPSLQATRPWLPRVSPRNPRTPVRGASESLSGSYRDRRRTRAAALMQRVRGTARRARAGDSDQRH